MNLLFDDDDFLAVPVKKEPKVTFDDEPISIKKEPSFNHANSVPIKKEPSSIKKTSNGASLPLSNASVLSSATPLAKPRKPRAKETKKRKPYNTKRSRSMDPTLQEMRELNIKSEFEEVTGTSVQPNQPRPEPKRNEDLMPSITEKLFNQRMARSASITDRSTTQAFRIVDELLTQEDEGSYNHRMLSQLEEHIRKMRNASVSLKTGLAHMNDLLMRGKNASKSSTIPIQTPWQLRTEVLDNQEKDYNRYQAEFNKYWAETYMKDKIDSSGLGDDNDIDDEECTRRLLQQRASSFFLGRGSNDIPSYLYNSDHLISRTGSRNPPDILLVGGGDPDTLKFRTHTVIASFCNDLNAGLEMPDIPMCATDAMVPDSTETGINSQDSFPIADPLIFE